MTQEEFFKRYTYSYLNVSNSGGLSQKDLISRKIQKHFFISKKIPTFAAAKIKGLSSTKLL